LVQVTKRRQEVQARQALKIARGGTVDIHKLVRLLGFNNEQHKSDAFKRMTRPHKRMQKLITVIISCYKTEHSKADTSFWCSVVVDHKVAALTVWHKQHRAIAARQVQKY
jgi:hypothetical protein